MMSRSVIKGWMAAIFVVAAAAVCIRLGFWQLDRHTQRQAHNESVAAGLLHPVLEIDAAAAEMVARDPGEFVHRRVRVRGEYLPGAEVIWRGRSHEGSPGVHLLTPLRVSGSADLVLVDRGWVPSPDATHIEPLDYRESGRVELDAIVRSFSVTPLDPLPVWIRTGADSVATIRSMDAAAIKRVIGQPIAGFYLQQLPSDDRRTPPLRSASPALGDGPHLGYAVQWFGFAAVFLVGLCVVALRRQP